MSKGMTTGVLLAAAAVRPGFDCNAFDVVSDEEDATRGSVDGAVTMDTTADVFTINRSVTLGLAAAEAPATVLMAGVLGGGKLDADVSVTVMLDVLLAAGADTAVLLLERLVLVMVRADVPIFDMPGASAPLAFVTNVMDVFWD